MQLILVNLLHPFFLHAKPRLLLRTYNGSKILQFDNDISFLLKIHVIFYSQYAKFRNAVYEKVHFDFLDNSWFLKYFFIKRIVWKPFFNRCWQVRNKLNNPLSWYKPMLFLSYSTLILSNENVPTSSHTSAPS